MFPIRGGLKQGDALSPLLFNFALVYTIRFQVHQDGMKLIGTHKLLVYADEVNILGRSVHAIKENAEALILASKEFGLEVNADKTTYMVMSRDQNAGRSHSIKTDNSSFGNNLTNQNSMQEESKSRLKSGNACYHSVQNLLSSSLLSKNLTIKICKTIILPVVLYGCENLSFTLTEERRLVGV